MLGAGRVIQCRVRSLYALTHTVTVIVSLPVRVFMVSFGHRPRARRKRRAAVAVAASPATSVRLAIAGILPYVFYPMLTVLRPLLSSPFNHGSCLPYGYASPYARLSKLPHLVSHISCCLERRPCATTQIYELYVRPPLWGS